MEIQVPLIQVVVEVLLQQDLMVQVVQVVVVVQV
jgi:hypothetical protein